jgi:NADH-quinone oxidoreductase subunit J
MHIKAVIFYIIAAEMLIFSVMAVTSRRILRAAVYLLFALAGTAALYFMIEYFFLAAVQLVVYAGGIVVLIIFSVLLTSHLNEKLEHPGWGKIIISGTLIIVAIFITSYILLTHTFTPGAGESVEFTMQLIGERMLGYGAGGYVLPFEVISILLLAAMIGAIVIAKRTPRP